MRRVTVRIERRAEGLSKGLNILASENYLRSTSDNYGWFVSDDFILPFYVERECLFGKLVFTAGALHRREGLSVDQERHFLSGVINESRRLGIACVAQPRPTALFNAYPAGATYIQYGSYRVDLGRTEDELFAGLHQKHRNVIRKALRDGIRIRCGPGLVQDCYHLIRHTMERNGLPHLSLTQLDRYRHSLSDDVSFYVAELGEVAQGCAVLIHDSRVCYYIHGGSLESPHNGALSLLHWTAMLDMKRRGLETYDFVGARIRPLAGTKQESIQRFKSRFGASLAVGYLWKLPISPWRFRLQTVLRSMCRVGTKRPHREDIIDNEIRVRSSGAGIGPGGSRNTQPSVG